MDSGDTPSGLRGAIEADIVALSDPPSAGDREVPDEDAELIARRFFSNSMRDKFANGGIYVSFLDSLKALHDGREEAEGKENLDDDTEGDLIIDEAAEAEAGDDEEKAVPAIDVAEEEEDKENVAPAIGEEEGGAGKRHRCEECGKRFKWPSELRVHSRTHTGEKPFPCDICGESFTQKSSLTSHIRTHTGERPFRCDICGRSFKQKGTMVAHRRIHTGEKPFVCEVCSKAFVQRGDMKKHMKRMH